MLTPFQQQRLQSVLILIGLCLAVYFLVVYQGLSRRLAALDVSLTDAWDKLMDARISQSAFQGLAAGKTEETYKRVQALSADLEQARSLAAGRVAFGPEVERRMREPFQLINFQNERQRVGEGLAKMAKEKNVSLSPAVLQGLPQFSPEADDPALLWGHLAMAQQLLAAALNSQLPAIQNFQSGAVVDLGPAGGNLGRLIEFQMDLEANGPMSPAAKFLLSLPLRQEELKTAGLMESLPEKPALFIDRILLRKQSPEKRDEVYLKVRVVGFAFAK